MHNEVAAKAECGIETFPFVLRVSVLVLKILISKYLSLCVTLIGPEKFGLEKNVSISVFIKFWSREQNMSFRFGWHLEKILKLFLRASITGAVCLIYKRK